MNRVLEAAAQLLDKKEYPVIAIDGRCAAGKSTLADALSQALGLSVVRMDDFFLPFDMRTPERLAEPGGNIHRERFVQEVIPHLGSGRAFSYRAFSCSDGSLDTLRAVAAGGIIVEGSYSQHPAFGDIYDLRIFADADPAVQRERILRRNGEDWWPMFRDRWIPLEEHYHAAMGIRQRSDMVVDLQRLPAVQNTQE